MPTHTKVIMLTLAFLAALAFGASCSAEQQKSINIHAEAPTSLFHPDDLLIRMENVTLICWLPKSANDHQQLLCHFDARSPVVRTTSLDAQAAKALIQSQRQLNPQKLDI